MDSSVISDVASVCFGLQSANPMTRVSVHPLIFYTCQELSLQQLAIIDAWAQCHAYYGFHQAIFSSGPLLQLGLDVRLLLCKPLCAVVSTEQYEDPPLLDLRFPDELDLINYTMRGDISEISIPPSLVQERLGERTTKFNGD